MKILKRQEKKIAHHYCSLLPRILLLLIMDSQTWTMIQVTKEYSGKTKLNYELEDHTICKKKNQYLNLSLSDDKVHALPTVYTAFCE